MLWAYLSFSQFLIIWSANLPEEIPWYLKRWGGAWQWVGLALIFGHFALPFVLLLSRDLKRNGRTLTVVALIVSAMRLVDLFWQIGPLHGAEHLSAVVEGGPGHGQLLSRCRRRRPPAHILLVRTQSM